MDRTILRKKYLECAKLLASKAWPDDLPDVLYDVIDNTKSFADKLKSNQKEGKSRPGWKRCSPNTGVKEGRHKMKNQSAKTNSSESSVVKTSYRSLTSCNERKLTPRVRITRLVMQNEFGSSKDGMRELFPEVRNTPLDMQKESELIEDGIQQQTQKRMKLEISEKSNFKSPASKLKILSEVDNVHPLERVEFGENGYKTVNTFNQKLSDGCTIQ